MLLLDTIYTIQDFICKLVVFAKVIFPSFLCVNILYVNTLSVFYTFIYPPPMCLNDSGGLLQVCAHNGHWLQAS